ncbi:hypothetical protein Daus18300_012747 [Diaporthe australafricana]|uniref:Fucose-specific lectin n=1 Tax=Diaporthe australafricana TaxID=127596 RepID=A0ABR3W1M0_9PEZI
MLPAEQDGRSDPEPVLPGHLPVQVHHWPALGYGDALGAYSSYQHTQHGTDKQAVDAGHDGLQLDEARLPTDYGYQNNGTGMEVVDISSFEKEHVDPTVPTTKWVSRKRILIAAGAALVLLIIAAVVGGVLGSRKSGSGETSSADDSDTSNSSTSTPSAPSPTETATTTLSSVKQGSSLAVAAWRKSLGLEVFLYYQSQNGSLRWSTYDDTQSSFTYNGSYWGDSTEIVMDSSNAAANGTNLAAGILLWGTTYEPQIELFYLDQNNYLRGAYDMNDAATYEADSVSDMNIASTTNSSLAAYWPYCAYVDENGEVAVVGNVPYSETRLSPSSNWTTTSSAKAVMTGSKLAVVPLVSNMTGLLEDGGYGVIYQDSDGNLAYVQPGRDTADADNTLVDSWPTGADFPSITVAAGGSFAAFTTARSDSSQGRVNTYVLYQEMSSRISMVYLDNDTSWVTKQPEALSSADNGTDIACLTMPMTQSDVDGDELDLEAASSHTSRCYFQRGGYIREFALSGTDWIELGTIPME